MSEEERNEELFEAGDEPDEVVVAGEGVEGDGEGGEEGGGAAKAPASVSLTPESIAAIVGAVKPPAQAAAAPQMTPEQVDELLGRFNVGEDDLEALGLPPASSKHFNDLKARIVREAVRTAAVHNEHLRRQLEQQFSPIRAYVEQARRADLQKQFFAKHKDLVGAEPVVEAVFNQMQAQGTDFSKLTPEQAFTLVAEQSRAVKARMIGGNGQLTTTGKKPTMLSGGRTGGKKVGTKRSEEERQVSSIFFD